MASPLSRKGFFTRARYATVLKEHGWHRACRMKGLLLGLCCAQRGPMTPPLSYEGPPNRILQRSRNTEMTPMGHDGTKHSMAWQTKAIPGSVFSIYGRGVIVGYPREHDGYDLPYIR